MLTLKPSDWGPASKHRVNFDHRHHPRKNQVNRSSLSKQVNSARTRSISLPRTENKSFSIPTSELSQIPQTKIKLISTALLKSCQFEPHSKINSISMPPHKNQFYFDPLKPSVFRPPRKPKPIPIFTLKSSQFRPPLY